MGGSQDHDRSDGLTPAGPEPFARCEAEALRGRIDAQLAALAQATADLRGRRSARWEDLVEVLDTAVTRVEEAHAVVHHLASVRGDAAWRDLRAEAAPRVAAAIADVLSRPELLRRVRGCDPGPEPARRRLRDALARRMVDAGADAHPATRAELQAIELALVAKTAAFTDRVAAARRTAGDGVDVSALLHADRADERREGWRLTRTLASVAPHDNRPVIREILSLRRRRARLLGHADFADLVTRGRVLGDAHAAERFVATAREAIEPTWRRQTASLLDFAAALGQTPVRAWDVAYLGRRQREHETGYHPDALRPYFELGSVVDGLFALVQQLLSLEVTAVPAAARWHPDVVVRRIAAADRGGLLYLDPLARTDKTDGRWTYPLGHGAGSAPAVAVCSSLPRGDPAAPLLLDHDAVRGLLHEFGHALHHLLGAGPPCGWGAHRVPWDFVEVPALLLEHWAFERDGLALLARHHRTRAPLPAGLYRALRAARRFRAASATMHELALAELDLALHRHYDPDGPEEPDAFGRRVLAPRMPVPLTDDDALVCSFSHLFSHPVGYAGGYHAYAWAARAAADVFARFEAAPGGVLDPTLGRLLRAELFEPANRRNPVSSLRAMLGRDVEEGAHRRLEGW